MIALFVTGLRVVITGKRNCALLQAERSGSGSLQSPRSPHASQMAPYLSISVTDPAKMGNGVQAYISYKVTTKSNLPDFQGQEKIVIRRYSDFVWLHDHLFEKYKGIFIPPLPEKSTVEKFRFSAEFIEMRCRALDVFINRIASHHELQKSEDLRIFLEADEQTMERARSQETSIFKKKPSDLMQIFKDVQSKVSDVVLGKEKPVEESNSEYEKLKHYIFELEDHLAEAQKHAYRLVKRHRELGQSLSDFGKAVKLLGTSEENSLGKAFSELGAKCELQSIKLQKEAHNLLMNFEEPLKDYVRAVQSIKATMAERANAFKHQCELAETIKFKEIDINKLRLMRSDKLAEAEREYEVLKVEGEEAAERFKTIARLMNEEIVQFQEQKTLDIGLALHEFAKGQAHLANSINKQFTFVLPPFIGSATINASENMLANVPFSPEKGESDRITRGDSPSLLLMRGLLRRSEDQAATPSQMTTTQGNKSWKKVAQLHRAKGNQLFCKSCWVQTLEEISSIYCKFLELENQNVAIARPED
nr:sorting nexin 1 [Ipomoea batatas]